MEETTNYLFLAESKSVSKIHKNNEQQKKEEEVKGQDEEIKKQKNKNK